MKRIRQKLFVQVLEDRITPTTFTVLNLNDSGTDSLRDCIAKLLDLHIRACDLSPAGVAALGRWRIAVFRSGSNALPNRFRH